MIIVKLMGGTGNQLFQYAIARSFAHDFSTYFFLDLSFYNIPFINKKVKHNRYNLHHFNIKENLTSYNLVKVIKDKIKFRGCYKITEPNNLEYFDNYIDLNENMNNNIYLNGYWQNEKYFSHNEELIRNDLKIITPPSKENMSLIKEISSSNAVALLIRRGDYLKPYHKAQFGNLTLSYYKKAVNLICKKIENPIFYIFSDDPKWVSENVKLDHPTIHITHNNGIDKDYEDLRLISYCKHFIISNSTFHWWGAWLSTNKEKIVIAPKPWFNSYTCENIVPDNWTKINHDNNSNLFHKSQNIIFETKPEKLELDNNQKIKFNLNPLNGSDKILKISVNFQNKGVLEINMGKINPIFVCYNSSGKKGFVDRYIYIDKDYPLNQISILNKGIFSVIINYLGIKAVDI